MRRGIVVLALAVMGCFLLLSHFDSQFSMIHVYESLIYAAIVVTLLYFKDRWAYMLGIVAPGVWMLLAVVTGAFGEPMREMAQLLHVEPPNYIALFLGGLISVLSVAMMSLCAYRWRHDFARLGKGLSTFAVSLGIVAAY
jgi:hypothetical protein